MKNGTLIITKSKSGFAARIEFTNDKGKQSQLQITAYSFKNDTLNNTICQFENPGGTLSKLVSHDGTVLFDSSKRNEVESPTRQFGNSGQQQRSADRDREPADSFSQSHLRVPADTMQYADSNGGDNFSLKLNHFARFDFKDNKETEKHFKFFNAKDVTTGRSLDIRVIVPAISIRADFGNLFEKEEGQIAERVKESAKSLFPDEGHLLAPTFRPEWRFVTGLGGHSVYETGITLHHVYGIPYIPASSVKGVLRAWIIQSHPDFQNNEGLAIGNRKFCDLFGCPADLTVEKEGRNTKYKSSYEEAREGKITFFDALPTERPTIQPDVMNPHYPDYYTKDMAPTDTQNPIPIFFLTVAKTPFQFLLGSKEWNLKTEPFWEKTLGEWLKNALEERGIGAKTAVGYGYMAQTQNS